MSERKAIYAASLDPITRGHINVIERTAPLYDKLIVIVAADPRKNYTFTPDERVRMARAATAHLPNVVVEASIGQYVIKKAETHGAQVNIRGMRNTKDLEDEMTLAQENRKICPSVETVWIPCLPELMHVSSSMVKSHVGTDPEWEQQVARSVPPLVVLKLKEKLVISKAKKHWATLMAKLGDPKGNTLALEDLLARYQEGHRGYHTLPHIVSMLDEFEEMGGTDYATSFGIWFHDAVYDPQAKDNEEKSAKLARDAILSLELGELLAESVEQLVMATKHGQEAVIEEAKTLLDLDLMILGKPESEFDDYEEGVREEYFFVPWADFSSARARILRSFLSRPALFETKRFRDRYEAKARANLLRSISKLEA